MKATFIGLGRMGHVLVERLLAAGHQITVYNRSPGKAADLIAAGAREATGVADAVSGAEVVLTMLSNDAALEAVSNGADGLIALAPKGATHIAMGTHGVGVVRAIAAAHAKAGQDFVAAPVLGRPEAVVAGKLGIIAAGPAEAVQRCQPLFDAMGRKTFAAGEDPGAAAAMKIANNFLLGCAIEAIGEAFSLTEKCGVDAAVFHDVVTDGLFASPAYTIYSRIISQKDYDNVGFTALLALKDINLAMAAGEIVGTPLPSGNVWRDRLLGAIAHGDGERDWAVMALEQARASGLA